jgi:cysteine desulfurase/selenocysteine lyase
MITATGKQPKAETTGGPALDVERIRRDFPILQQRINGKPLIYLDSAATSQKPKCVIDAISGYYTSTNANIHRGVHTLSVRATEGYESARRRVRSFINAARPEEIVFVRGATEGINLIAQAFARPMLKAGDEVLITTMEHHSNIVPWQILCDQTGAVLRVAPINDAGELLVDEYRKLIGPRTKIVSFTHISNALGTINPVRELVALAHDRGAFVVIDGAQAVPHLKVDLRAIGCDFYVFSGHKMFGPTGVGVLYGRFELLDRMGPYQGGGEMIKSVTFEKTIYNDVPHKFEAGTPDIGGAIGLGAAVDYMESVRLDRIAAHEHELLQYGTAALSAIPEVKLIGTAREKAAVLSFTVGGIHPHDVGTVLDHEGIAVRTGHHCAQPVMNRFGVPATVRASLAFYNTRAEIDALADGIRRVVEVMG